MKFFKAVTTISLLLASSILAQAEVLLPSSDDSWHYQIDPYAWLSSLDGTVTVDGKTNDVHLSFNDILRHMDFGAEGHFEAGKGPWSLMLDATYIKLSDNFTVDTLSTDLTQTTVLIDGGLFYRILAMSNRKQAASLELLAGGREYGLRTDLDVETLPGLSDTENSLSPIVGARFKLDLNQRTHFWVRGDVGGFHVDGMNSTWSIITGLSYTVAKHVDVGAAYRALKIDFSNPTKNFASDITMSGPMIGFSIHN